jgi:G3E family GTPase
MVNDFGAVNIDAQLVDAIEGDVVDLSNGCVCCTMRGGLVQQTLKLLSRRNPPDYLVVEASGISDPVGVAGAFRTTALREQTRLDAVVALVDVEHIRDAYLDQQLIHDQLASADVVVLNKVDLVDEQARAGVRAWVQDMVPQARLLEAVRAQLPLDLLFDLERSGRQGNWQPTAARVEMVARKEHEHDLAFEAWSYLTTWPLAYGRTQDALSSLPSCVFRAKGILHLADAPGLRWTLQMVGRRLAIDIAGHWAPGEVRRTELVFIGKPGALDQTELIRRLDTCVTDSIVLMSHASMRRMRRVVGRKSVGTSVASVNHL